MNRKSADRTETGHGSGERAAPQGEGWTAGGPGNGLHHPAQLAPPGKTRRTESTRTSAGKADDLGTSGSRGDPGPRDGYSSNTLPGDSPGSHHSHLGRRRETPR